VKWVSFDSPQLAGLKSEGTPPSSWYEKWADKGALLAPVNITGHRVNENDVTVPFELNVNVVGTHLQSSNSAPYDAYMPVRKQQFRIVKELMDMVALEDEKHGRTRDKSMTTAMGDFNVDGLASPQWHCPQKGPKKVIKRTRGKDKVLNSHASSEKDYTKLEKREYAQMLKMLNMTDVGKRGRCENESYSSRNSWHPDMTSENLDYILFREPLPYYVSLKKTNIFTDRPLSKVLIKEKATDLSDHQPVVAFMMFNEPKMAPKAETPSTSGAAHELSFFCFFLSLWSVI
jgi:endonuclease/exonuclease/phosphatase family metal-dependent hydrolase